MPYAFVLPTTSSFSFSSSFSSKSHPSLPLTASTYRGVLRDTLKKHKRLPPTSQSANLSTVVQSLDGYIPYLLAVDAGLSNQPVACEELDVVLNTSPSIEWRPTLTSSIPGRELPRAKVHSLEYEVYFTLATHAYTQTLLARSALHPLYSSATASPSAEARTSAITTATKYLLSAASAHAYLARRSESLSSPAPCVDIATPSLSALSSLALAEATLLAVLKDDPYPAAVAQERNKNDKEWMIKGPQIPKVRAHLYARLCLAAAEQAARALSLFNSSAGKSKDIGRIDDGLLRYVEDLRKTGRGKACRFFGIDAELGGETGKAIAWLRGGMHELGITSKLEEKEQGKGSGFGRFKKDWTEKREDKKIEKGTSWGSDAGRFEEGRVLEMLEAKWVKMNDTVNTQIVPPSAQVCASMPSGREIHSIKNFELPTLDIQTLECLRAPPDPEERLAEDGDSSDEDEFSKGPVGAFPGTQSDYAGKGSYY